MSPFLGCALVAFRAYSTTSAGMPGIAEKHIRYYRQGGADEHRREDPAHQEGARLHRREARRHARDIRRVAAQVRVRGAHAQGANDRRDRPLSRGQPLVPEGRLGKRCQRRHPCALRAGGGVLPRADQDRPDDSPLSPRGAGYRGAGGTGEGDAPLVQEQARLRR